MAEQADGGDHGEQAPVHFFVHIPKCGGNTFSDFLARQFPLEKIYTAEKSTAAWEDHRRDIAARAEQLSRENKGALLRRRFIDGMRQHDLVMWDNRAVMHRARRYDHTKRRDMHRTTVADSAPTLAQAL